MLSNKPTHEPSCMAPSNFWDNLVDTMVTGDLGQGLVSKTKAKFHVI